MDYGSIARSRSHVWALLLVPVAAVTLSITGVFLFSHRAGQSLDLREEFMATLPDMEAALATADDLLARHDSLDHSDRPAEALRDTITRAAAASGFTITSLGVQSATAAPDKAADMLKGVEWILEIDGEGNPAALLRFCSELQQNPGLLVIEHISFEAKGVDNANAYAVEFLIGWHSS